MRRRAAFAIAVLVVPLATACGSSKHAASPTATPTATVVLGTTSTTPATSPTSTGSGVSTAEESPPPPAPATPTTATLPPAPTSTSALDSAVVQETLCPSQQEAGLLADFGHGRSVAAAQRILQRAAHVGFKNLRVERRSCHDYAVVLSGLKSMRQAHSLQREAATVNLRVALDCRSHPVEGGIAAVFGHRRTRRAAVSLLHRARAYGFEGLQVQQDRCNDWEVDLYGLKTAAQRRAFSKEAASVGLHVVYEPG